VILTGTSETRKLFGELCLLHSGVMPTLEPGTAHSACGPFLFVSLCAREGRFVRESCLLECELSNLEATLAEVRLHAGELSARDLLVHCCGLHQYAVSHTHRRAQYLAWIARLAQLPAAHLLRTTNAVNYRRASCTPNWPCSCPALDGHQREAALRNNVRVAAHAQLLRSLLPADDRLIDVYRITAPLWRRTMDAVHFPAWVYRSLAAAHLTLWRADASVSSATSQLDS